MSTNKQETILLWIEQSKYPDKVYHLSPNEKRHYRKAQHESEMSLCMRKSTTGLTPEESDQPVHRLDRPETCCPFISGPVIQSIVSIMTSLRRQLVKYMPTSKQIKYHFCWKNVRIFCNAMQEILTFFQQKSSVIENFTF